MRALFDKHGNTVLAVGLAVVAVLEILLLLGDYEYSVFVPLALIVPLALLWRVRYPLAVMALNIAAWVVIDSFSPANEDPLTLAIVLAIAVYSVGAHTEGRRAVLGAVLVASMALLGTFVDWNQGSFLDFLGNLIFFGAHLRRPVARRPRDPAAAGRERDLIVERDEQARAAVPRSGRGSPRAARRRRARDQRDRAAGARRAGTRSRAEPDGRAGRRSTPSSAPATQALAEMRRLLGVLRDDDEELALRAAAVARHSSTRSPRTCATPGCRSSVRVEGERARAAAGRRPLGLPHRPGGAHERAQARRARARAACIVRYGAGRARASRSPTTAAGADERRRRRPRAGRHARAGRRSSAATLGRGPAPGGGYVVRARLPL